MEFEIEDIVIVVSDGVVYDVYAKNNQLSVRVIDLDTGDIADDRDYEAVSNSDNYNSIY